MQTNMTIQPQAPVQKAPLQKGPAQQIPAHVAERLENEWRQMRQGAANTNRPQR